MSAEDVDHDLALSPHLKALQSIRLEEEGGCCVIQSETEELGLLAAAYVAARHGAVYRNDLLTLEDFLPTDPMTQEDLNEESSLELGGFLPIHRLRPNTVSLRRTPRITPMCSANSGVGCPCPTGAPCQANIL